MMSWADHFEHDVRDSGPTCPLRVWTLWAVQLMDFRGSWTAFTRTFSPTTGTRPTTALQHNHKPWSPNLTLLHHTLEYHEPHGKMNLLIHDPMMLLHLSDHSGKNPLPHLNTASFSIDTLTHEQMYLPYHGWDCECNPILYTWVSKSDFSFSFACTKSILSASMDNIKPNPNKWTILNRITIMIQCRCCLALWHHVFGV